jgi:predicted ATPase
MSGKEEEISVAERNLDSDIPIFRFVFTGGPCGGKTTALARVFSYLRERGFQVITCPEAYTTLSANGMSVDFFSTPGMALVIQKTVMDVQMTLEDSIHRVLKARGKPGVMLCDRGTMDGRVYLDDEEFDKLVHQQGTDMVQLRDSRYDAVFHLVTAADGAEAHYSLDNNKVRTETIEQAIQVDKKTQQVWVGHPHLYCVDNSTDFEGKMSRLVDTLSKIVGLPSNLKRRSAKFLVKTPPDVSQFPPEIHYQEFEVEKIYLKQSGDSQSKLDNYSSIRRRTNIDRKGRRLGTVYQLTVAQWTGTELIEQKRIISEREYSAASLQRDEGRHIVRQRRISFLYDQQSFGVHIYESPARELCILHAQVEASTDCDEPHVDLPPFLSVDRRILNTEEDKEKYGAYSLSIIS